MGVSSKINHSSQRYTKVAIMLHWVMAIAFVLMLGSGFLMGSDLLERSTQFAVVQWHKSLGVVLLVAFFIRIGWRLFHKPPALPASFKQSEVILSHLGHLGLYALMFLMPLTGWAMVSASVYGLPTIVFGMFEWPHIPWVLMNEPVHDGAAAAHNILAWAFLLLILGHVAAVLKHAIWDKENILPRMWWKGKK